MLRADAGDHEVFTFQAPSLTGQFAALALRAQLIVDRFAVDAARRENEEADWVDGCHAAAGQHRALRSFLAASLHERAQVREVPELRLVYDALCAGGRGSTHLSDDYTDLSGWHLHQRTLVHAVQRPELEAQAGHEQVGLVAGLAFESDDVPVTQLGPTKPLGHQTYFCRPDLVGRCHEYQAHDHDRDDYRERSHQETNDCVEHRSLSSAVKGHSRL